MKSAKINQIALLLVFATLGCQRSERKETEDRARSGETTEPRAENPSPSAAPGPTSTAEGESRGTVRAGEKQALGTELRTAKGKFQSVKGQKLSGDAEFSEVSDGVKVVVDVSDATKGADHLYVYDKADCSDIESASMGKRVTKKTEQQRSAKQGMREIDDLGTLTVSKDGQGKTEIVIRDANLKAGDANSLLGKAIVIESSNAKPVACAVIGKD